MAAFARSTLIARLPVAGAAVAGLAVAGATAAAPAAWLAGVAADLGAATAGDGVGLVARLAMALAAGLIAAAVGWAALYLLWGPGGMLARRPRTADGTPAVRRADAHPDAPPRRPFSAAELVADTPEPERPEPERPLPELPVPADLDTPLAALDPAAIPATPREPVRALAALAPGERLDTFALTLPVRPAPAAAAAEPPSIEALLRRLEAGAERRALAR